MAITPALDHNWDHSAWLASRPSAAPSIRAYSPTRQACAAAGIGLRILVGALNDRAGAPFHETAAALDEALALLRSRFATI
jgi:hypothetical protein